MFTKNQALIVVDMQLDFCDGGALAVSGSEEIIPDLNKFIQKAVEHNILVIFTKDMHPQNHKSFSSNGGIWPDHCVVETKGSHLHPNLYIPSVFLCVHKGVDIEIDGYSAFEKTNLDSILKQLNITNLLVTGVATDYCVLQTAMDASKLGFDTTVIKNLTKAVNSSEDNLCNIWQQLQDAKVKLV